MSYTEQNHADTVAALCGRFQTQNRIILALVAVVALLAAGLMRLATANTVHVYEVLSEGQSRYHGQLQSLGAAQPSLKEAEFVARRFSAFLLDRNSSTVRSGFSAAGKMCSDSMQDLIAAEWKLDEVAEKVEREAVRTDLSWGGIFSPLDDGVYRVKLHGTQTFFPIERARPRAVGESVFEVEVSLRRRSRDPLLFPNGLEVIGFHVLRSEAVGESS